MVIKEPFLKCFSYPSTHRKRTKWANDDKYLRENLRGSLLVVSCSRRSDLCPNARLMVTIVEEAFELLTSDHGQIWVSNKYVYDWQIQLQEHLMAYRCCFWYSQLQQQSIAVSYLCMNKKDMEFV